MESAADEELAEALAREEIEAFFQPVVYLESEQLAGFEALARWRHPRDGIRLPHAFLPRSDTSRLVSIVGWRVLRHACQFLQDWKSPGRSPIFASVNLAANQLADPDAPEVVEWALDDHDLSPKALCLEVAASLLSDAASAGPMVRALQATGCAIAIDDFGTAGITVDEVVALDVDEVKLDRSLVVQLEAGEPIACEIEPMIKQLTDHEVTVCAKGIETVDVAERLQELGCAIGQGFLFSEPMPAEEAHRFTSRPLP